ncbi:hypothetical protein BC835DRAFT_1349209 [Cytidiella melzeri]|nr:hypothetical protein BC835DRAFT_1349209 [Cytidiella melzeri]
MATRQLTLHASALTNEEYTLYTTSLCDLAGEDEHARRHYHDDSYYAALKISAREARAWIRGRYTDLPPSSLDAALRLFCPNLAVTDVLSGGQFFAALRLVTHMRHGKTLDGNLVFVQAHPDDSSPSMPSTSQDVDSYFPHTEYPTSRSQPSVPARGPPPPPPPKPAILPSLTQPTIPSSSTNPFINRSKTQPPQSTSAPAISQLQSSSQPSHILPPLPPRKSTQTLPPPPRHASLHTHAPVVPDTPATPSAFAFWSNQSQSGSTPTSSNVLIQQSLQAGRIAQSLKKAEQKLEKERVLEVLKSSSKASSSSSSVRTRSISPTKESSVLLVSSIGKPGLISSKTNSMSSASGSASASSEELRPSTRASTATITTSGRVPALPPRRASKRFSPPPSSAASTRSFEQVANASIPPRAAKPRPQSPLVREPSPMRASPPPQHPDLLPPPPPTHPDRKPRDLSDSNPSSDYDAQASPTSRVFRSKSMHYTSPPVPPPRRRPESVQYGLSRRSGTSSRDRTPSPTRTDRSAKSLSTVLSSPASLSQKATVSRHMSLSMHNRRRDSLSREGNGVLRDDSTISSIKNTLMGLQPKLEAARYKAEAGLSKRGYVSHGNASFLHEEVEERLVPSSASSSVADSSGVSVDSDDGGLGQDVESVDVKEEKDGGMRWENTGRMRSSSGGGLAGNDEKPRRPWNVERDEMKWPTGEGWRPL